MEDEDFVYMIEKMDRRVTVPKKQTETVQCMQNKLGQCTIHYGSKINKQIHIRSFSMFLDVLIKIVFHQKDEDTMKCLD